MSLQPGQQVWQHYRHQVGTPRDGFVMRPTRARVVVVREIPDEDLVLVTDPHGKYATVDVGWGPGIWSVEAHRIEP